MCISGASRPIPKREVWAWKVCSTKNGKLYPRYVSDFPEDKWHRIGFKYETWMQAQLKNEEGNSPGFHAFRTRHELLRSWHSSLTGCWTEGYGRGFVRIRLRGIIEATSEGYRAKEMFIPKPKKAKRHA